MGVVVGLLGSVCPELEEEGNECVCVCVCEREREEHREYIRPGRSGVSGQISGISGEIFGVSV